MKRAARLGIGTAQFAFAYGATNRRGRVAKDEARRVLRLAARAGMGLVHTSSTYGDCESLLGCEADVIAPMRIALKLPPLRVSEIGAVETAALLASLERSRAALRRGRIDSVLFHEARELTLPGARRALDALLEAKALGAIGRIGVTAYDPQELAYARQLFVPEVVQIPLNLLDQRFAKRGLLADLKRSGMEIHVRSVFLQGTLLVEPDRLPAMLHWARSHFGAVADFIEKHGLTRLQACLSYVLSLRHVDSVVVGVTGTDELDAILAALETLPSVLPDFSVVAVNEERIINPTHWQTGGEAQARAPTLAR
jgi:aryl-alcohol dehydrogenase-like predicted oxidoreductase